MNMRSLLMLCLLTLLPSKLCAADYGDEAEEQARWFEIELILFRQLDDKSKLQEKFPTTGPTVTDKRIIELLAPYLQPDIRSLKQLVPVCFAPSTQSSLLNLARERFINEQNQQLFKQKSLDDIALMLPHPSTKLEYNELLAQPTTAPQLQPVNVDELDHEAQHLAPLTPQQQRLLAQAEQASQSKQFPYLNNALSRDFCQLPMARVKQLSQSIANFSVDGFTVQQVPKQIDAADLATGDANDNPYLMSADKLQLTDIVKQLKRSKNFSPLLHLGWRQAPESRRNAIPIHIFAGDNLNAHYQQQLSQYQHALQQAQSVAPRLNADEHLLMTRDTELSQQQQLTRQQIDKIITDLSQPTLSESQLLASVSQTPLAFPPATTDNAVIEPFGNTPLNKPMAPVQAWSVEGYFTVHLNHYLFIDADFTIVNKTLAEQATEALKQQTVGYSTTNANIERTSTQIQRIPFKQNRRVISQEIHYFDHPYLGMIVQIRRYTPPMASTDEPQQAN